MSAELPEEVRLAEIVAILALGQDGAFGQPLESQLRSTLLAAWLAEALDLPLATREATYWTALLRFIGCTGHAHEVSALFGDEIEARARTLLYDSANPSEVLRDVFSHARPERRGLARIATVFALLAGGRKFAEMNFRTGCEVADALAARFELPVGVREAVGYSFERWNGKGQPHGVSGEQIPLPMRIVHVAQEVEVIGRVRGVDDAAAVARERSGRAYDPAVAGAFCDVGAELFARLEKVDPWDEVLLTERVPHRTVAGDALDDALTVVADFADLKSPYTAGHSRGVATLAGLACNEAGLEKAQALATRRAALVHDLGRTVIPNSIWEKPSSLTRAEFDRVELHPLVTEQMLRRSSGLAALVTIAAAHHERADGSGYVKGLTAKQVCLEARILGAADRYHALTEERPHRPAMSPEYAAAELRRMVASGHVDSRAAEHVLSAAGHRVATRSTAQAPNELTEREVEVLRLVATGLTTKDVATRLFISPKTTDTHIQHIYRKIGVSTRGAAALYAMQNDLLG